MFSLKVALVLFTIAFVTEGCDEVGQEYEYKYGVVDPNSSTLFVGNGELSGPDSRDSVKVTGSPGWHLVAVTVQVNTPLKHTVKFDYRNHIVDIYIPGRTCTSYSINGYYLPKA